MTMILQLKQARSTRREFCSSLIIRLLIVVAAISGGGQRIMAEPPKGTEKESAGAEQPATADANQLEEATFGSGCFWCTEAVYQQLKGVKSVVSGYCGGHTKNPTYKEVCTGQTGHAEVIRVTYDPKVVSYTELLEVFFKTHDPTTKNRQGNDEGPQYRSVIFYHNEAQKKLATEILKELDASGAFKKKIVTEISPLKDYYPAEDYHQNYYRENPGNPYCQTVVRHKVEKFRAVFKNKLKENP